MRVFTNILRLTMLTGAFALVLGSDSDRRPIRRIRSRGKATGLVVYEAGWGKEGPKLTDGTKFCPAKFSTRGFTVVCKTEGSITHIKFLVNGKLERTETQFPYVIAGDSDGMLSPWTDYPYPGKVNIACVTPSQRGINVTVDFSCPKPFDERVSPKTVPQPIKTGATAVSGGLIPRITGSDIKNDVQEAIQKAPVAPTIAQKIPTSSKKPTPSPSAAPAPSTKPLPIQTGQKAPEMVFKPKLINKPLVPGGLVPRTVIPRPAQKPKPTQKPKSTYKPKPVQKPKPMQKPKPTYKPKPIYKPKPKPPRNPASKKFTPAPGPLPFSKSNCVAINAKNFRTSTGSGPWGWLRTGNGVVYKKDDGSRRTVRPLHQLTYTFTVPKTSHYAIVLDMTTRHYTEHNIKFPYGRGVRIMRGKSKRVRGGFLKAYHNHNRRASASYTVDFRPHSMSTADVLKPGQKYNIVIAGRSSKVTVHRILLFPYAGNTCHSSSGVWQRYIRTC